MTINEAYLVALRATVTLTYIPVMAPGLYDTFSWASWDISWAYYMVSLTNLGLNINISVNRGPGNEEMDQYTQEMT